jgi:hypothetical protein
MFGWVLLLLSLPGVALLYGALSGSLSKFVSWLKPLTISCVAIVLLCGALVWLNGACDRQTPRTVSTTIRQKIITPSSHGAYSYRIVVDSWRSSQRTEYLEVGTAVFHRSSVGDTIIVTAHRGLFGFPWYQPLRDP